MFFRLRIIIALLLIVGVSTVVAQNAETPAESETSADDVEITAENFPEIYNESLSVYCQRDYPLLVTSQLTGFYDELDKVSRNNQVVSQQIDSVFAAYNDALAEMSEGLEFVRSSLSDSDVVVNVNSLSSCDQRYLEARQTAQTILGNFLKNVSQQKQDLALIQQYDVINEKSGRLLEEISQADSFLFQFFKQLPECTAACAKL